MMPMTLYDEGTVSALLVLPLLVADSAAAALVDATALTTADSVAELLAVCISPLIVSNVADRGNKAAVYRPVVVRTLG